MNESSEKISAVLPTDLHSRLVEQAREADRSLSAEIRCAVRSYITTSSSPSVSERSVPGDHPLGELDAETEEER